MNSCTEGLRAAQETVDNRIPKAVFRGKAQSDGARRPRKRVCRTLAWPGEAGGWEGPRMPESARRR